MTDIEKEFLDDVRCKKQMAHSARHRKNGSRSKKCTLTTDRLTNKQIRERHGETIVYNLKKPMKWSDFKRLPAHAQEEYLMLLCDDFGTTATDIAKMFGVIASTVLKHIDAKRLNIQFQRGHRMSRAQKENWLKFLAPEITPEPVILEDVVAPVMEDDIVAPEVEANGADLLVQTGEATKMSEITLRFDGVIDVGSISNTLRAVLGNQSRGCLFIGYSQSGCIDGGAA